MSESNAHGTGSARRRRILIVDDNPDGAESLALLLEFGGHEVSVAHDGPAALAAAEHWKPDAVLLDIGLPGMSGLDVCRHLRSRPWGQSLFVIAVSGWAHGEFRWSLAEAGFDFYIAKPIDHEALAHLLSAPHPDAR